MSDNGDIEVIGTEHGNKLQQQERKKRSATNQKTCSSGGPPPKKGDKQAKGDVKKTCEDPLPPKKVHDHVDDTVVDQDDEDDVGSRSSRRSSRSSSRSNSIADSPYDPQIAAIRQEVSECREDIAELIKVVGEHITSAHKINEAVKKDSSTLATGITVRNKEEKSQLDTWTTTAFNLAKELKEVRDHSSNTRQAEQTRKIEQDVAKTLTAVNKAQESLTAIQNFLAGMSTAQRFSGPSTSATNNVATAPTLKCNFCDEKSDGSHLTQDCPRYATYADRLARALKASICNRCLEKYDNDASNIHRMCANADVVCDICSKKFNNNVPAANHHLAMCPFLQAKRVNGPRPKDNRQRSQDYRQRASDKQHNVNGYGYMRGAFNSQ